MSAVSEDNLDIYEEKDITLYARTNYVVVEAPLNDGFHFNEDASYIIN
ncbi:MAG: hypothetical protein LBQ71_11310 [Hungatella sp.]|jgi:hypothetical protein|nr:hypothetical protein [Hungatella sp.]